MSTQVLNYLSKDDKKWLFMLLSMCLPLEVGLETAGIHETVETDHLNGYGNTWSGSCLLLIAAIFDIETMYIEMYIRFAFSERLEETARKDTVRVSDLIVPLRDRIDAMDLDLKRRISLDIMALLAVSGKYDARGRILIFNFMYSLNLDRNEFLMAENLFQVFLKEYVILKMEEENQKNGKKKQNKMLRYAKIGAASVGAGAVIALTGGLAAPAIAGALLLTLGSSSIAAAATVTTMATLWGTAGAGLAGYKMMKRTRGIQEFEIEQHSTEDRMAAVIVVSGWMENAGDYRRSFGVVPPEMELEELLTRYYALHCPARLPKVKQEVEEYSESNESRLLLLESLLELTGVDPRIRENLCQRAADPCENSDPELEHVFRECVSRHFDTTSLPEWAKKEQASSERSVHPPIRPQVQSESRSVVSVVGSPSSHKNMKVGLGGSRSDAGAVATVDGGDSKEISLEKAEGPISADEGGSEKASSRFTADEKDDKCFPFEEISLTSKYWDWKDVPNSDTYELFVLKWETELQLELGGCIRQMVNDLQTAAVQKAVATAFFSALASAVMLPALLLKLTDVIDSLWTIAVERADEAGQELAEALLSRPPGSKPVTLIGFSMGARVIFSCLRELSKHVRPRNTTQKSGQPGEKSGVGETTVEGGKSKKFFSSMFKSKSKHDSPTGAGAGAGKADDAVLTATNDNKVQNGRSSSDDDETEDKTEKAKQSPKGDSFTSAANHISVRGIVQDVVLLGAPVSAKSNGWAEAREVVSGRLVNGYSNDDMVLGIIYRLKRFNKDVGGITPVEHIRGIENVDLSSIVKKHSDYCVYMKSILEVISLGV